MDSQILLWINSFSTPWLDTVMLNVTVLGDVATILAVTFIVSLYLARRKQRKRIAFLLASVLGVLVVNSGLKLLFARPRPDLWDILITETTYSFPSGHAALSLVLAACVVILMRKSKNLGYVIVAAIVYVLVVGFSRMYLGVHYPSDVIAGWVVATLWIVGMLWVGRSILRRFPSVHAGPRE